MPSPVFHARRLLCALRGTGPRRISDFDTIARDRASTASGVHRAEDFTGVLHSEPGEPALYPPVHSLLGQSPAWEILPCGHPRYLSSGLAPAEPRRVLSLARAGVITSDGVVYCLSTRRAVGETVRRWTAPAAAHPVLAAPGYPPPRRLPGLTLSLLTLSGEGFYHLLLEAIPRLALLRPWLHLADHILCAGRPGGFHEAWLAHAGVRAAKIVWMHDLCHVACDQLLFTTHPMRDQQPTPWTVQSIRSSFPLPAPPSASPLPASSSGSPLPAPCSPLPPRRLWISRRDAAARLLTWEDDLLALLPGFERIELAALSPARQIALAASADVIAGPHGAGLAHVIFGHPGARAFELFPATHHQPIYARLASLAGLDYAWAKLDFTRPPADLPAFAATLLAFCTRPPAAPLKP